MLKKELNNLNDELADLWKQIDLGDHFVGRTDAVLKIQALMKKVQLCIDLAEVPEHD